MFHPTTFLVLLTEPSSRTHKVRLIRWWLWRIWFSNLYSYWTSIFSSYHSKLSKPVLSLCWCLFLSYQPMTLNIWSHPSIPDKCHQVYVMVLDHQCYNLSGTLKLDLPRVTSTSYGLQSFRCAAPQVWNTLPDNMRPSESLIAFKRAIHNITV